MILLVNAGFGQVVPSQLHEPIRSISRGIRTPVCVNDSEEWIGWLTADAKRFGQACFLVAGWDWRHENGETYQRRDADLYPMRQHLTWQCEQIIQAWRSIGGLDRDLWIDYGNELDMTEPWRKNLGRFRDAAMLAYRRIRAISPIVKFITGSVANLESRSCFWQAAKGLDVLKKLCKMGWPEDTLQGVHPYRPVFAAGPSDSDLLSIVGKRRFAVTEMGYASKSHLSDDQIAEAIGKELERWKGLDAACYAHFQIQDGPRPDNSGEGGFGAFVNVNDWTSEKPEPKPVAEPLREWAA